ncbi:MAG: GTPase Era [Patescibacteria group bacterium]|nr:GTPase Era [Patescibacteria group bacterium]
MAEKQLARAKKEGTVLLIGRPNVGKSTFINNLIGTKVSITSPKPQTTRFPIMATYEDDRGSLHFIDTPGIFGKAEDFLSKRINEKTMKQLDKEVDAVIYMIDHTRRRDFEESKVLGLVRKVLAPKFLVINKIDLTEKTYAAQYRFLEDEFPNAFAISALQRKHFEPLIEALFQVVPEEVSAKKDSARPRYQLAPQQNYDSFTFLAELIREKIFLHTGREVPYTTTVVVDEVTDRSEGLTFIKARILTTHDRYKKMLIGKGGEKIKDLGRLARKEIELGTNKKIFLELTVETDPHWQETFY